MYILYRVRFADVLLFCADGKLAVYIPSSLILGVLFTHSVSSVGYNNKNYYTLNCHVVCTTLYCVMLHCIISAVFIMYTLQIVCLLPHRQKLEKLRH